MAILNAGIVAPTGGYQISRSLRFNSADSAYLNRTPGSAGNRKTWTWSGWVKRSALSSNFGVLEGNAGVGQITSVIFTSDKVLLQDYTDPSFNINWSTNAVFRDVSAWYHVVIAFDTTQASSANAVKIYVNGVQQAVTFQASTGAYTQNRDSYINATNAQRMGTYNGLANYFNGYLTEINFIDGQALTPSSFGETDTVTGVWKPKAYSGSYGTNGFYLKFADNSGTTSTTLGKDSSGNGNNWTPNNFSVTAGAGNDSLVDTPTPYGTDTGAGGEVRGNYATLNPLDNGGVTLSNGNLRSVNPASVQRLVRATIFPASGKWYWEAQADANCLIGVASAASSLTNFCGASADARGWFGSNGQVFQTGSVIATYASYTSSDVLGFALDVDAGTCQVYKNNVSQGTWTSLSGVTAAVGRQDGIAEFNFGQRPFAYTAPSGFKALCTQNLPETTIKKGNEYFDATLYTGNGGTLSVTNSGFRPDLVWNKCRNSARSHELYDSVRGVSNRLVSNSTQAADVVSGVTAFNSNGYTLGSATGSNTNGDTYVGWQWRAGGTPATTNTAGTITSTVSVNTTSGFSIVTYTGTGSAATVGHGLGVAPSMVIVKKRSTTGNWATWHTGLTGGSPEDRLIYLNLTDAQTTVTDYWGTNGMTSTTFGIWNTGGDNNQSGQTFVAYCFAPVAGYSAMSSYTGNGSADGPFIFTNHRPAFVLIKRTDTTSNWTILDFQREGYNVDNDPLYPNLSNAEGTTDLADLLSNGFKLRTTDASVNASGGTYIYMSLASNPFKYSLGR